MFPHELASPNGVERRVQQAEEHTEQRETAWEAQPGEKTLLGTQRRALLSSSLTGLTSLGQRYESQPLVRGAGFRAGQHHLGYVSQVLGR